MPKVCVCSLCDSVQLFLSNFLSVYFVVLSVWLIHDEF